MNDFDGYDISKQYNSGFGVNIANRFNSLGSAYDQNGNDFNNRNLLNGYNAGNLVNANGYNVGNSLNGNGYNAGNLVNDQNSFDRTGKSLGTSDLIFNQNFVRGYDPNEVSSPNRLYLPAATYLPAEPTYFAPVAPQQQYYQYA